MILKQMTCFCRQLFLSVCLLSFSPTVLFALDEFLAWDDEAVPVAPISAATPSDLTPADPGPADVTPAGVVNPADVTPVDETPDNATPVDATAPDTETPAPASPDNASADMMAPVVITPGLITPEADEQVHVDNALRDLLRVLDEETELATRTRMNIDFVPGMVSVLHGRDLLARGKRTVYEALEMIPGVELSKVADGQLQVIVRGVGKTRSSAKIKFLLNGVAFNATLTAVSTALIIPLEHVDRIEVIRGPGSVIHGEFASVGVVNVITYSEIDNDQLFARVSSEGHGYTAGGQVHEKFDDGKSFLNITFAQHESEGGDIQSGPDRIPAGESNAPGDVNDAELDRAFVMNLQYADYFINWQFVEQGLGDYFGNAGALPSESSRIVRTLSMQSLEVKRPWQISTDWSSILKTGWSNFVFDSEQSELEPPSTANPEGVLGAPNYVEDKYYIDLEAEYGGMAGHNLLLGLDLAYTRQGETFALRNYTVASDGMPIPATNQAYTGAENWLAENLSRKVMGFYVQDQYALTDRWRFTAGLRYDDYDDIDSDITPRMAVVYQYSERQTFKAQYAQSFRPPTFLEMYSRNNLVVQGNPALRSEQLDSFELGYVFNDGMTITRATLFWFDLEDLISVDTAVRTYTNKGGVQARGIELEYLRPLGNITRLDSNLSLINSDISDDAQVPGVAHLMANIGLIVQPWPNYSFTAQYRYVGERERETGDTRSSLGGYSTVDFTASAFNFLLRGLTVRMVGKNIFDEDVRYPSFLAATQSGARPPYEEDYPQSERTFELQAMYEFK